MSKAFKQETIIQNRKGLHARASAQVVMLAETFKSETYICFQDMRAPACSIMSLLMLGAGHGSHLIIEGEGEDADLAVVALVNLVENKFGEG
jgi:phosphocarrier protein HPr